MVLLLDRPSLSHRQTRASTMTELQTQLRQEVHSAIQRLPQSQRLVTVLFYVEGYSQQEIADYLELPVSAVKKRLFDARRNFKGRMIPMVQEHLQQTKPSQNDHFANA